MTRLSYAIALIYRVAPAFALAVFGFLAFTAAALAQDDPGGPETPGPIVSDIFASSNEVLFALLAPAAIPWVLGVVIQSYWSPKLKQAVTFVVCWVVAAAYLLVAGETVLAWDGLPRLGLIVSVVAYGYFRVWYKPIEDVEQTTTRAKG